MLLLLTGGPCIVQLHQREVGGWEVTSRQIKMSLVWHKWRVLPCHGMTTLMIIFIMRRNNNSAAVLRKVKIGATMRQQIEFPHQNRSRISADRNVPTLQWKKSLCSAPAVQIKSYKVLFSGEVLAGKL